MKFVIVFVCVVALAYGEYKISPEFKTKVKGKVLEVGGKCAMQEHANEADIKELKERKRPSTKEGKCMLACMNHEFGSQDKDGKFTKEGLMKSAEPYKSENVDLYNDIVKLLVETCLPQVKSSDRCDAAVEMAACYMKNASDDIKNADSLV